MTKEPETLETGRLLDTGWGVTHCAPADERAALENVCGVGENIVASW